MWVLRICISVAVASRELWAELGLVHCRYKERTPAAGWAPVESCRLMWTHPNPFHFKKTAGVCKCRWPRVTPNHSGSKVNLELSAGPPHRNVTQSLFIRVSDWLLFKHEAEQLFDVACSPRSLRVHSANLISFTPYYHRFSWRNNYANETCQNVDKLQRLTEII